MPSARSGRYSLFRPEQKASQPRSFLVRTIIADQHPSSGADLSRARRTRNPGPVGAIRGVESGAHGVQAALRAADYAKEQVRLVLVAYRNCD